MSGATNLETARCSRRSRRLGLPGPRDAEDAPAQAVVILAVRAAVAAGVGRPMAGVRTVDDRHFPLLRVRHQRRHGRDLPRRLGHQHHVARVLPLAEVLQRQDVAGLNVGQLPDLAEAPLPGNRVADTAWRWAVRAEPPLEVVRRVP